MLMARVKIFSKLDSSSESLIHQDLIGILNHQKLFFKEDDYRVNISWDVNKIKMIRCNDDVKVTFTLNGYKESNIEYAIKKGGKFLIPILVDKVIRLNNCIFISYEIIDTGERIKYEIKWEENNEFKK